MVEELEDAVYEEIIGWCERANALFDEGNPGDALPLFMKALELIPEPKERWETSTWVLTAIGDCLFSLGEYERALKHFRRAVECPDVEGAEFLQMRLGQTLFELGEASGAREELDRALVQGGEELFEEEDPKYLGFLRGHQGKGGGPQWH